MKEKIRYRTAITEDLLQKVQELAEAGLNNIMIAQALNIGVETLSRNKQLKQSIQCGKQILAKKVTTSILNTLEKTPTNQQMLVRRLCLFNPAVDIKKPSNAKDALANLSTATQQYADGEINESQLRTIEAVSNSYLKGVEVIELEERVTKLEEMQR